MPKKNKTHRSKLVITPINSLVNSRKQTCLKSKQQHKVSIQELNLIKQNRNKSKQSCNIQYLYPIIEVGKQKIINKQKQKSTSKQLTSKTNRKIAKLKIDQMNRSNKLAQISYREYCMINGTFIPVTSQQQQQILNQVIQSTTTSSDFIQANGLLLLTKNVENESKKNCAIMTENIKMEMKQCQIDVCPEQKEIGNQYSERFEIHKENKCKQSLSDLLLKLEFKHLPDSTALQGMSRSQKQHYSQLLSTLLEKLAYSPRIIRPCNREEIEKQNIQYGLKESKQTQKIETQKIAMKIHTRQCQQMGWIPSNLQPQHIDTSLLSAMNFICDMFCYIQLQHAEETINGLKKIYGFNYHAKYRKLISTGSLSCTSIPILHDKIYTQFCTQIGEKTQSDYQLAHNKAIFDAINQYLDSYRPYYRSYGESYPWSTRLLVVLNQYIIDQDALELVLMQIKQKIIQDMSYLCGIIVPECTSYLLDLKHKEREDKLVVIDRIEVHQNAQNEDQATLVMQIIAQMIQNEIFLQFTNQFIK